MARYTRILHMHNADQAREPIEVAAFQRVGGNRGRETDGKLPGSNRMLPCLGMACAEGTNAVQNCPFPHTLERGANSIGPLARRGWLGLVLLQFAIERGFADAQQAGG